ncbi:BlaI/MecI/CopY family transcriptional regulator [Leadbetterella byssophila]|jgi:BlaI family penicillinase repressor|uniref:BlaI/MecI/CopY family transcriptional regulator n=1 Tax=Leadbetterella byssophila TaxID=316068 RepID=UPI00399F3614
MEKKPTESELEILQILWRRKAATVKEIHEELKRDVGYTTTLKMLQLMFEKGLVTRKEEGRSHQYMPLVEETSTQHTLLEKFIDTTYRGSASRLVMQALGNQEVSKEELDEIKRLIQSLENKQL